MAGQRVITDSQTPSISHAQAGFRGLSATARLFAGLLALGLVAAGLYLVPEYATYGLVFLGLGTPLVLLLWRRPEFGLLTIILLSSSFVPADVADLRLEIGGGLDLRDITFLVMIGLLVFRRLVRKELSVPWWPVGGPLLLFLAIATFSTYNALFHEGVETNWALNDLRILSYYGTFFLTIWSLEQPRQLKALLIGLFIIADLTVGVILVQQFLGADNPLLEPMARGATWKVYEQSGAVRVIPAGIVLVHFLGIVALCLTVFGRNNTRLRLLSAVQFAYISIGLLLTYTRSQWAASALALGLIFVVLWPRYKHRFVQFLFVGVSILALVVSLTNLFGTRLLSGIGETPLVAGVIERAVSVLTPDKTMETGSLEWRRFETEEALRAIGEQPLTGVGLGNSYRNLTTLQGEATGRYTRGSIAAGEVSRFTRYVHNSYLSIAVKMGLPALIVFLWFCAAFLRESWQLYQIMPDSELRGIVLGTLAGFVGLLAWCVFHAYFIKVESTPTIGLTLGLIGSIAHLQRQGMRTGSDGPTRTENLSI